MSLEHEPGPASAPWDPERKKRARDEMAALVEQLIRSKQRVSDHGEVFTPAWLVEDMLDLVKGESERIDARFLEPACGSGNFVVPVLRRKLATAQLRYRRSEFERRHNALFGLMCIYGIELLADNATECRKNLVDTFVEFIGPGEDTETWRQAAETVVAANIVCGNALAMTTIEGDPIVFPEWSYLGKGRFQRRDFRFDELTQMASYGEDTLFSGADAATIFAPERTYPSTTVEEIARGGEP